MLQGGSSELKGKEGGGCQGVTGARWCGEGKRRGRMLDQGMLRFVVLKRLAEQPRHGYDLMKLLQEQSQGVYIPSPGMIYPMLSLLEDQGYVSTTVEGNKRLYALTEQGRHLLQQNLSLAVAIEERLATLGNDAVERTRLRLHALRDAVQEHLLVPRQDPAALQKIQNVLTKALEEIQSIGL